MFMTGQLAKACFEAIQSSSEKGSGALSTTISTVVRYPIKALAAFFVAPLLAFRIARIAKNPLRRAVATIGMLIAVLLAWLAGTFLGSLAGAALISSKFGFLVALGFLVGTTLSVVLSVTFSILVLNATCLFFVHASKQEVIDYLVAISE